jgi:hypothetical protein
MEQLRKGVFSVVSQSADACGRLDGSVGRGGGARKEDSLNSRAITECYFLFCFVSCVCVGAFSLFGMIPVIPGSPLFAPSLLNSWQLQALQSLCFCFFFSDPIIPKHIVGLFVFFICIVSMSHHRHS